MPRDSQGVKGISGYNPKEGSLDERVARYTREVSELEYKLSVAKKLLEKYQRQLKNIEMASIGITPTMLCDALKQYRQEFEGVLSIDLYDSGQEWEGVIVHMPEYSWVIGIHGQDPAWDSNGYLDWSIYKTGIEDGKLYLDEYLGMGVANDSAGWSLEKVVAKICQVIRGGAMASIPDGFQVGIYESNQEGK
jgi:hypothetical protein